MAPSPLTRLIVLQQQRHDEIKRIGDHIRHRAANTLSKTIIQTRINMINDLWADVRKTHTDIALRAEAFENAYITENKYAALQDIYENTLDVLLTALPQSPSNEERNPRRREREDDDHDDCSAKLPRLDLPTFSGKHEDWDSFADIFTTLVHNAPRIADTTKLQYLKSCLKGSAAELVKDVTILGINYDTTWKALKNRFHNPRLTINNLLDAFINLPHLKKESASDLRSFIDNAQRIVRSLKNLRAPVVHWDLWLVHLLEVRLDTESRKHWEAEWSAKDQSSLANIEDDDDDYLVRMPKFVDLAAFLERRAQSLIVIQADKEDKRPNPPISTLSSSRKVHHAQSSQPARILKCGFCEGNHFTSKCSAFLAKTPEERKKAVREAKLCFNCLGRHKRSACPSKYRCKDCTTEERHHTLLHSAFSTERSSALAATQKFRANIGRTAGGPGLSINACNSAASQQSILLATAQVTVIGPFGRQTCARVLLDQGSEATFVSESLVQLLQLKRDRVTTSLMGIGGCTAGAVKHATSFTMKSNQDPPFKIDVNAFVLPRLTSELPSRNLVELELEPFKMLPLADPEFYLSDRVDILIGADLYGQLLRAGLTKFPSSSLVAQNTALGWVISVSNDLSDVIERFWTVEEVPVAPKSLKPQDEVWEKLFAETHKRTTDGRFQVRLPLNSEPPRVADETRRVALGSLQHLLRRFSRDPTLQQAYTDFMETYIKLGHMIPVPRSEIKNTRAWYHPHHPVITGTAEKPKIRVVFDASRRTHDKYCLNELLMSGPALQSDLSLILLNWRRYKYVFTADIVKIFRQILVAREDQDLQRILWSRAPGRPAMDYRLTTVTYGTACAPFLAIRTLLQLASDEKTCFPLGAACLESNTYVDDTFAGADDLPTAVRIRDEFIGILKSAGIELDKWAANHPNLLPSFILSGEVGAIKQIDTNSAVKTLGVHWNPSSDAFSFSASILSRSEKKLTKRSIYSDIARLYDPLGWLAPVTVLAKIIMQDLWIEKCDWDEPLSAEICDRWQSYCQSLSTLHTLSINRWLGLFDQKPFEIHGFSDASSRAYAAVVYLRIDNGNGNYHVSLLTAKTKVAPVKTVSIPNLELCGATLLVKLVVHLQKLKFLQNVPIRLWSDSQVVLTWLKKHPCHWKTFVANRVSLIQTELPSALWSHVPTKQNPADLATRGAMPDELRANDLWWTGPMWLLSPSDKWPQPRQSLRSLHTRPSSDEPVLLARYSSLTRLIRITAWCLRPILQKVRQRASQGSYPKYLTLADIDNARTVIVRVAQAHTFSTEIELLRSHKTLPKRHYLCKLQPFLDKDGILRVGGRLSNANLPRHLQYPPILPRSSSLSRLFVSYAHE
ncbi:uncharacterized protein LOC131668142 [Phymastichus coffea]|uniref:uncharacterized protein LOC131668142 n=1 Tax=Phymastichus coffea TaxID=108790 RepID=UPI00273CC353|nr:uncharacterized protein LOC131668142 [Phymastichus coffea]